MMPHWAADMCGAWLMDTGEVASAATVTDKASPSSPVPVLPTPVGEERVQAEAHGRARA